MTHYIVAFMPQAIDDLERLDTPVAQRILKKLTWLSKSFDSLPGEMLSGEFKGFCRLRTGSYRVIYTADRERCVLTVHMIGHRRDIYKRRGSHQADR